MEYQANGMPAIAAGLAALVGASARFVRMSSLPRERETSISRRRERNRRDAASLTPRETQWQHSLGLAFAIARLDIMANDSGRRPKDVVEGSGCMFFTLLEAKKTCSPKRR